MDATVANTLDCMFVSRKCKADKCMGWIKAELRQGCVLRAWAVMATTPIVAYKPAGVAAASSTPKIETTPPEKDKVKEV